MILNIGIQNLYPKNSPLNLLLPVAANKENLCFYFQQVDLIN